jgi:hypothetical protein
MVNANAVSDARNVNREDRTMAKNSSKSVLAL